jgi:CDP-diacylglycerol--glycerol-3-phosphate 3-phosphatidyltransferase
MPSIYQLKPAFQRLLRPLVARLVGAGVTPSAVTVAALLLSFAVGAAVALLRTPASLLLLPPALLVRMALNALDGMMAREHGLQSPLGGLLNEVGDVLADAALYLPLALVPPLAAAPIVLAVTLAAASELAGVAAVAVGASRRYDGPMGKSDRAFVYGALALLLGAGVPGGRWLDVVLWAVTALVAATVVNRLHRGAREARARTAARRAEVA